MPLVDSQRSSKENYSPACNIANVKLVRKRIGTWEICHKIIIANIAAKNEDSRKRDVDVDHTAESNIQSRSQDGQHEEIVMTACVNY